MSFNYQGAYVGPFSVSVGRGKDGEMQKFRYPVPVKRVEQYISQALFVLAGRVLLSWSTGEQFVRELGPGGSFTEDAPDGRPMALDEELTVLSLGSSAYVCVAPVGIEQKVYMRRSVLQPGEALHVPRYDLAVIADGPNVALLDGSRLASGSRFFYGRNRGFKLSAEGPTHCAVFSMLG